MVILVPKVLLKKRVDSNFIIKMEKVTEAFKRTRVIVVLSQYLKCVKSKKEDYSN